MEEKINIVSKWLGSGSINIFGKPFAGKDTQGIILANLFGGVLEAGGDILRSYHDQDKIQKIMATGDLIPSDLYLDIIVPYLSKPELVGRPLFLSAVGRSHGEGPIILQATESSGHPMNAVILLHLTEEEVWNRFEQSQNQHDRGNRADDNKEVLKNRLKKFQQRTMPVIEFYREKGLLIEIDGTLSEDKVTAKIIEELAKKATEN
jgi:adenylate kinase